MKLTSEHCLFCRSRSIATVRPYVCPSCLSRLPFRRRQQGVDFGPLNALLPDLVNADIVCPFFYEGKIREAILRMKFAGSWYPARALGPLMAETILRQGWSASAVVPLPLHPNRQRQRGFNQAERLARLMADTLGLPVIDDALIRFVDTPRQSEAADQAGRYKLVFSAFKLTNRPLPSHVFLVDDVLTTGTTLLSAARVLAAGGIGVQPVVCASNHGKPRL